MSNRRVANHLWTHLREDAGLGGAPWASGQDELVSIQTPSHLHPGAPGLGFSPCLTHHSVRDRGQKCTPVQVPTLAQAALPQPWCPGLRETGCFQRDF